MKNILVLMLVFVLFFSSACNKVQDEEYSNNLSSEELNKNETEVIYDDHELIEKNLSFVDGTLTARYSENTDLSDLNNLEYCEEVVHLKLYLNESHETMILTNLPNVVNLTVEVQGVAKHLDISSLNSLKQVTLLGSIEEIKMPQNVESISVDGKTNFKVLSNCENLKNIEILGLTNLEDLKLFENLESVSIKVSGCDLSQLNDISFSKLMLSNINDEELTVINGCLVDTLQIDDENVMDLGIIERLPNLKVLFFTIASSENPYVTTFMEPTNEDIDKLVTPADVSILKQFISDGGTLYLMTDPNR